MPKRPSKYEEDIEFVSYYLELSYICGYVISRTEMPMFYNNHWRPTPETTSLEQLFQEGSSAFHKAYVSLIAYG